MFKYVSALAGTALLSACASQPEDIQAAYVSPNIYANYTCPELFAERERIVARVNFVADAQSDKATNDAVATGVGIILFWPALFLLASGSDREAELASLKGNYDAIEQSITTRKCALESPSGAASQVAASPSPKTDSSFEAQQRSINGEAAAPAAVTSEPVVVAAAPAQPAPAAAPAPAAPQQAAQPEQRAPEPQPERQSAAAAPQPAAAPQQPVQQVAAAPKPTPVAAAAASPSIPASLYDDPNLAEKVDYSRAEIREYCGQAWRIRDLTDGTFEINPCYDRRYN